MLREKVIDIFKRIEQGARSFNELGPKVGRGSMRMRIEAGDEVVEGKEALLQ